MKRFLLGIAAGFAGGTLFGALGIFIYPCWLLNDVAMDSLVGSEIRTTPVAGAVVRVNPADRLGKRTATVYDAETKPTIVRLEETFTQAMTRGEQRKRNGKS